MTASKTLCALVAFALTGTGTSLASNLSRGDILMSRTSSGSILAINPISGLPTWGAYSGAPGSLLVHPMGIAVDSNGTILVADAGAWDVSGDGKIIGINPSTKEQWVISSDVYLDDPYGIALEASGNILVTDGRAGPAEVLRIDRASGNQSVVSTGGELINPDDIAVGPDGWIYLADAGDGAGYGGIIKINPFTGEQSYVEPRGIHDAVSGIAVDGTGRIYFPDDDPSEIWTILPPEESELVSSGDYLDTGVRHIDLDLNGNVTVTDFTGNGSGGELLQINPTTGEQRQIMTWDGDPAWGIAVYPFPEPATLSLLAFGGLAVMRRRRRSTVR